MRLTGTFYDCYFRKAFESFFFYTLTLFLLLLLLSYVKNSVQNNYFLKMKNERKINRLREPQET